MNPFKVVDHLRRDAAHALRALGRQPGFAAVVVVTLALGIGVNAATFSLFEQLLLRPLPVAAPDELANLVSPGPKPGRRSSNQAGNIDSVFSYPMFRDLERLQEPFVGIAGHRSVDVHIVLGDRAATGNGMLVSGAYFPLLGVAPVLGRLLGPQDDAVDGEASAAALSYTTWRDTFGADPAVLGRTLLVNGKPLTIVGVAPEGFHGTTSAVRPSVFLPVSFSWTTQPSALPNHTDRRTYWLYAFARLKPGVTLEQAEAAINGPFRAIINEVEVPLQGGMDAELLEEFRAQTVTLAPGARGQSGEPDVVRAPLTVLVATTLTALLIACANVANLMLARASTRVGEFAVRASLGAGRRRLISLLAVESLLLAGLGAAAGVPVALAVFRAMQWALSGFGIAPIETQPTASHVGVVAAIAVVSAVLFGVLPALKAGRVEPAALLQAHGARSTGGRGVARFRAGLAMAQVALSMTLLVTGALFAQSLANVARVELGIDHESVATFTTAPELVGYDAPRTAAVIEELQLALAAAPGVISIASSRTPLLSDSHMGGTVSVQGVDAASGIETNADFMIVGGDFFRALGGGLLQGRHFDEGDDVNAAKVAIVNQRFVEHFGLGATAVGARIALSGRAGIPLDIEIVGVTGDAKLTNVKGPVYPTVFLPRRQASPALRAGAVNFYVRAAGDPDALLATIRAVVTRVDASLPLDDLGPLEDRLTSLLFTDRFTAALGGMLAALATLLAGVGLYGVLSYTLTLRTRELGLRVALGAAPRDVRAMITRQVAVMAVAGGLAGLFAAWLIGRAARSLLFEVNPGNPAAPVAAAVILSLVVVGAAYWPARRASRIDPVVALRCD